MDGFIYMLIGLVILYIIIKLLKWPLKLLLNGIAGVVLLWIANLIGAGFGIHIGINLITALIAGIFGIPGVLIMLLFTIF